MGSTWTQLGLGIGLNDFVLELTIDPNDASRIWVGVDDALGSQPVNVMLSTNGGATWSDETPPLATPMSCRGIALDPGDSTDVYLAFGGAFGGGQLWVTTDGGANWVNRSAGLPNRPMNDVVHDGTRALVTGGQAFGSQTFGLYSSANQGVTWTALHDGSWPSLFFADLEIDPNDVDVILLASTNKGVFRSPDGGSTWSFGAGGTSLLALNAVRFAPGSSSVIYTAAYSAAVWKSSDGAATFASSSAGLSLLNVVSVASNPGDPDELAAAFSGLNNGGIYSTLDGGQTWLLETAPATRWNAVRFAPDGTLYALSDGPSTVAPEGVYRRSGGVWTSLGPNQGPLFESELYALRFSRTNPSLLLAAGRDFGVAGAEATIWRSTDAGANWTKTHEGPVQGETVRDLAIVRGTSDQVALATYDDFSGSEPRAGGVLRSTNGGATWSASDSGLPLAFQGSSLSPAPAASAFKLSDGAGSGLYASGDSGQSWTSTGFGGSLLRVVGDPYDANRVYVAKTSGAKVSESIDGGATFTPFDAGLATAGFPADLQFAETDCGLLLGTGTGGYRTPTTCPFVGDVSSVSVATGGSQTLSLDAGTGHAGDVYLVLGSFAGTSPGLTALGSILPLNADAYFLVMLATPNNAILSGSLGTLDGSGIGTAVFTLPAGLSPALVGLELHHAFLLPFDTFASNAVALDFAP